MNNIIYFLNNTLNPKLFKKISIYTAIICLLIIIFGWIYITYIAYNFITYLIYAVFSFITLLFFISYSFLCYYIEKKKNNYFSILMIMSFMAITYLTYALIISFKDFIDLYFDEVIFTSLNGSMWLLILSIVGIFQSEKIKNNQLHISNNVVKYVAIGAAIITLISVFLPWVEATSSASFMGETVRSTSGPISGFAIGGGLLGLSLAIAGGYMAFKQMKWAFIPGAINFLNGLGYMLGWFGAGGTTSYSTGFGRGSASASVDPQIGLYLFVIASFIFVISTLKNLKLEESE